MKTYTPINYIYKLFINKRKIIYATHSIILCIKLLSNLFHSICCILYRILFLYIVTNNFIANNLKCYRNSCILKIIPIFFLYMLLFYILLFILFHFHKHLIILLSDHIFMCFRLLRIQKFF